MNYKILYPEKDVQRYYVIPAYVNGGWWGSDTLGQEEQILNFIKNRSPDLIKIRGGAPKGE